MLNSHGTSTAQASKFYENFPILLHKLALNNGGGEYFQCFQWNDMENSSLANHLYTLSKFSMTKSKHKYFFTFLNDIIFSCLLHQTSIKALNRV